MDDKQIVEKIIGTYRSEEQDKRTLYSVYMTHDQLQKTHQKVTSAGGRIFGISLDENEKLFDGAILWQDEQVVVVVTLEEEDVLEVRPLGNEEWARVAFNIGNMHHPAYIYPNFIRVPYDAILESMLQHLGSPVVRKMAKLDGVRANGPAAHNHNHSTVQEHTHSHSSGQEHNHTHHEHEG